jgi:hypothetical protein
LAASVVEIGIEFHVTSSGTVSQQTQARQEYACTLDEVLLDQEINVKKRTSGIIARPFIGIERLRRSSVR